MCVCVCVCVCVCMCVRVCVRVCVYKYIYIYIKLYKIIRIIDVFLALKLPFPLNMSSDKWRLKTFKKIPSLS